MALWVDKHRPTELSELSYHLEQASQLADMVKTDDFPHLLVHGPSGAGKKTRIKCLLRELFGSGADRLHMDTHTCTAPSGKKLEIRTISSNYHIELSPGDVGIYDRVVVQDIVKQMAQSSQLDNTQRSFKIVLLTEVDLLTRDAQHALRRTMEKYSGNCRLILCCEALSRVIEPLQSRCMTIRVAAPSDLEIKNVVQTVCQKEEVFMPPAIIAKIVEGAAGNLRKALLMAEAVRAQAPAQQIDENQNVPMAEWCTYLKETADLIVKKQNNENVMAVRERIYELLSRCIPATVIFKDLVRYLLPYCSRTARLQTIEAAALFEHRMTHGQKAIYHLEAFILAFMEIYLNSLNEAAMRH